MGITIRMVRTASNVISALRSTNNLVLRGRGGKMGKKLVKAPVSEVSDTISVQSCSTAHSCNKVANKAIGKLRKVRLGRVTPAKAKVATQLLGRIVVLHDRT